ncbi:MAG: potassium channel family protein, partial [Bacteroidota bacterium]
MKMVGYNKLLIPIWIIISLLLIGTIGYHVIDGYSFFNAFYMTVITIASVGYGEIEPLSTAGRIFTSFLIIFSFGTFAYAVGLFTKYIVEGEIKHFWSNRKLNKMLDKLSDHIIVCGYGRNGHQASMVLHKYNKRFVVIEKKIIESNSVKYKDVVLEGDATSDEVLIRAGILRAKALITTLPNDADNLFICLTARNLNPQLTIISRASEDSSDAKLRIAGANNVIMPDKIGGAHMAS